MENPFGITSYYDKDTDQTIVSFSYLEDSDIKYFELQVWDDILRKWVPYDKMNGVVRRDGV
jgi:hypothetical protein